VTHPDYDRWQRGVEYGPARGMLARDLLTEGGPLGRARVLDAGCGRGLTVITFDVEGCAVTGIDINVARLRDFTPRPERVHVAAADALLLPFAGGSFDVLLLQDVIEHTASPLRLLREAARVLAPGGLLYLSTPNRESLVNLLADPHWGLPFVARKRGEALRRVLRLRRPTEAERRDLPQLLSQRELREILAAADFMPRLVQREVCRALFRRPEMVVWSRGHLRLVRWMRRLGLQHVVPHLVPDHPGAFNRWIAPAWYVIATKSGGAPPEGCGV
jgi:SAM-dependent methyltransferase